MTDLEFLRAHIPRYADYGNTDQRHEVDKQIRAYLGEALAEARDRLRPTGEAAAALDALLLRCEFSNPKFIVTEDKAKFDQRMTDHVHTADRAIVDAADRVREASTAAELDAVLDAARRALEEREAAVNEV